MGDSKMTYLKLMAPAATLVLAAVTSLTPAWGAMPAHPGMLNYVEGTAAIDNHRVTSKDIGSADLEPNQVLSTAAGRAEILMTPGVFLRLAENSAVRMISPALTDTEVEVTRGRAMLDVGELHNGNHIAVLAGRAQTLPLKNGLYNIDAANGIVQVFDGKARVIADERHLDLGKGRQVLLASAAPLKAQKFDRKASESGDPLYTWSSLRSGYLSEASAASAQTYLVNGYGWYGDGWYWNPGFGFYSWMPGDGLFYSPFGFGFASPWYFYGGYPAFGFYGGGRYGGFAHHGFYRGGYGRGSFRSGGPSHVGGFARSGGFSRGGFGGGMGRSGGGGRGR
jgi:hypothetical protein